ncbi:helix-turn-helix transcriptional regulator [Desulfobotulus alkaliphilus]
MLIRRKQLKELTGLSPSTAERWEKAGKFPARRCVGPGVVGWLYDEVREFMKNTPTAGGTP